MAKKDNAETVITPFGVAQYPWLTKEDPTYGGFKVQIKLTSAELKALKAKGDAYIKANFKGKKIKGTPFRNHDELGEVFAAKSKYAPVIVNSSNQKLDLGDNEYIGSGSTVRLLGEFGIANDYLCFYLRKVQVRNLVLGAGGGEDFPEDESEDDVSEDDADADSLSI
jgi:hypothetical protein